MGYLCCFFVGIGLAIAFGKFYIALIAVFGGLVVSAAIIVLLLYIYASIESRLFQRLNYYLHSQSQRGIIFAAKKEQISYYTTDSEGVSKKRYQEYVYLEITVLDSAIEQTTQNDSKEVIEDTQFSMPPPSAPQQETSEYVKFQYFSNDPDKL